MTVDTSSRAPARARCLDPHDCVVSKLVAGREKDYAFAGALLTAGLVDGPTLTERLSLLENVDPVAIDRVRRWLSAMGSP